MNILRRYKEARAEAARELAENPEDSSSGKRCKQLYKIGEQLGRGAFSVVKEGTHKQTGKSYAIKIVNKNRLNEQDAAALKDEISILMEFKADKDFKNSHIVELHDVFEGTDYHYLITERFFGGCLATRINEKGLYKEEEAKVALRTVFDAIVFTHARNVVHRDLKLENLLLAHADDYHTLKVIDFGFAKRCSTPNGLHTMIGTPGYVSPCILKGNGYGAKADIWSLGVIVFIMLSGSPPFANKNRDKLFNTILQGKYSLDSAKWDDVTKEGKDLVRRLLSVDPAKRSSTIEALDHPWFSVSADPALEDEKENEEECLSGKSVSSVSTIVVPETGNNLSSQVTKIEIQPHDVQVSM